MKFGSYYASLQQYHEKEQKSEFYQDQKRRAFCQSRAGRFYHLCYERWEGMGTCGKGICDDVVCLIVDGTKLTSSGSSFTDAVKITSIWVEPAHRSKGHCREVLVELTKIADKAGCVIIAVSNPIEFPENFTAKDALRDNDKDEWDTSMKYVKYGYRKKQARTNGILKSCGFQNIDMGDWYMNAKRCRVQDSWAYVPDNYARHLDWDERGLTDRLVK
jgi:ribosomal protein S18 acetylase RimI-like enzyme